MSRKLIAIAIFACLLGGREAVLGGTEWGQIHPNFRLNVSERFRMTTWDNTIDRDWWSSDSRSFVRQRIGVTGQWLPSDRFEAALKLTNEFRYYFVPQYWDFDLDEVIVDQLYLRWRKALGRPATITVGRQNLILGEGFVMMDGYPLDGSRTIYFNAARLDYLFGADRQLTLFYVYQPENDDLLPIINDQDKQLIEQPEVGFGVYFAGPVGKADLHAYVIRKNMRATYSRPNQSEINTVGARVTGAVMPRLSATAEGAYQFGKYGDADRSALGGYGYLTYATAWPAYLPGSFTGGIIYLSGDDPGTGDHEGWDPVFARWPKWSESFIYTLANERAVAYWTNFISLHAGVRFDLPDDMQLHLVYRHLMAPESPDASAGFPYGTGKTRGDMLIAKLDFRISKYLSGHILWESFNPGNYYFSRANRYPYDRADPYHWARVEFLFKI
ncbi:MAG TPA: alginate export family protein [Acidobacteriota bacterium]|nr:alginate export family protein [Acidobacteriota bacterium]